MILSFGGWEATAFDPTTVGGRESRETVVDGETPRGRLPLKRANWLTSRLLGGHCHTLPMSLVLDLPYVLFLYIHYYILSIDDFACRNDMQSFLNRPWNPSCIGDFEGESGRSHRRRRLSAAPSVEAFAVPNGAGGVGVPGWAVCGLVGMLLGVAVLRFSTPARMPRWHLALLLWDTWAEEGHGTWEVRVFWWPSAA